MREDFWQFSATHKIWLACNHKPIIRGTDHGIWRRIKLVPFNVVIADKDQDKELVDKLAAERLGHSQLGDAGLHAVAGGRLERPG